MSIDDAVELNSAGCEVVYCEQSVCLENVANSVTFGHLVDDWLSAFD